MATPVEPSPPWDDPPSTWDDVCAWFDDQELPPIPDEVPEWLLDDADAENTDAEKADAAGPSEWAVPGVDGPGEPGSGGDGQASGGERDRLSTGSRAALAETAAAFTALRLAQARCYQAITMLEAGDAVDESGYRNLSRLLNDHVRIDDKEATRLARHARSLTATVSPTGTEIPPELPATAGLVTDGTIGPGHVEVIRATMRRLSAVIPPLDHDTLTVTEAQLAELATTHSPHALAEAAKAILALLDPDGTAPDDSPPPPNELHYQRRRNGSLVGKFTYRDPADAEALHTALTAATPPPEPTPEPPEPGQGPRGESYDAQALRTLPARRAHALLDLAAEALTRGLNIDHPSDPAATTAGSTAEDTTSAGIFDTDPDEAAAGGAADAETATTSDTTGQAKADDSEANDNTAAAETDVDDEADDETGTDETSEADDTTAEASSSAPGSPPTASPPTASPPPGPPGWTRADLEGGERVALTVTLNYDTLRAALTHATGPTPGLPSQLALLGENSWVRPETARRLACDAEIIPVVLNTTGELLDLGRKHRLVTRGLRRAVIARDRHCAHPGCRRRARTCQVHHIQHWADHGDTSLENCVLLCSYHHHLVHHDGWQIHMVNGLPWFTPPAWLDPQQRARHNRPWLTDQPTS